MMIKKKNEVERIITLEKEKESLSFSPQTRRHGLERRRGPGLLQQEPVRVHRVPPGQDKGSGERRGG